MAARNNSKAGRNTFEQSPKGRGKPAHQGRKSKCEEKRKVTATFTAFKYESMSLSANCIDSGEPMCVPFIFRITRLWARFDTKWIANGNR